MRLVTNLASGIKTLAIALLPLFLLSTLIQNFGKLARELGNFPIYNDDK